MVGRGEPVGAYWAAITHPHCDPELDESLANEMHLIAHQEFAARRATLRQKHVLEERCAALETRLAEANSQIVKIRTANAELARALQDMRAAHASATQELARWCSGEAAEAASARERALLEALDAARSESAAKERALREALRRLERASPEAKVKSSMCGSSQPSSQTAPKTPALQGLSQRQLLCIGGKTSLLFQYRAIVEKAGAYFSHHDGGIEHSVSRLPAMLSGADVVVCLTADCSHGAYRLAKRYCKAKNKDCLLLGNSGVSAFARAVLGK